MRIGRFAPTLVFCLAMVFILFLFQGGVHWLLPTSNVAWPKTLRDFFATSLSLVSLLTVGLIFRRLTKKFPAILGDEAIAGGPKVNLSRAGTLVAVVLPLTGGLIWLYSAHQIPVWLQIITGAIAFCVLLLVINWLELRWTAQDTPTRWGGHRAGN